MKTKIKEIRLKLGWSVETLAEKSKVNKSTISRIENGIISPRLCVLLKIAKALNVDICKII